MAQPLIMPVFSAGEVSDLLHLLVADQLVAKVKTRPKVAAGLLEGIEEMFFVVFPDHIKTASHDFTLAAIRNFVIELLKAQGRLLCPAV